MSDRCKEEYLWLRITVRFQYTAVKIQFHCSVLENALKCPIFLSEGKSSFLRTGLEFSSDKTFVSFGQNYGFA